jgi:hypothetical protein
MRAFCRQCRLDTLGIPGARIGRERQGIAESIAAQVKAASELGQHHILRI